MLSHPNPFLRGYQNLRISRSLFITYQDDCPPAWRPVHPSQAHLSDGQVARFPCIFSEDFALITEGQEIPDDLVAQCQPRAKGWFEPLSMPSTATTLAIWPICPYR